MRSDRSLVDQPAVRRRRRRLGLEVEARDPHPPRRQRDAELGPELPHPARHDGNAPGRSNSGSLTAPIGSARQTASHSSRTQPCPPGRSSTQRATARPRARHPPGRPGSPTASRHVASLTSLPNRRLSRARGRRRGLLAERRPACPRLRGCSAHAASRPRAATTGFGSVETITYGTPTSSSRRRPIPSPRQHATDSSPRSFTQTRLSVKTPSKSKTTSPIARSSSSGGGHDVAAAEPARGSGFRPARRRRARSSRPRRGRAAGAARASPSSSYGGRPPSAGDLRRGRPRRARDPPGAPRRDELLAHLLERLRLARQRPLDAVADRGRDALEVAHELPHPLGHQREGVIGALRGVAQREVLLDDAGAEHVRDERHRDPVLVVGEADHELGVALAEGLDHAQVRAPRPPPGRRRCTGAGRAAG